MLLQHGKDSDRKYITDPLMNEIHLTWASIIAYMNDYETNICLVIHFHGSYYWSILVIFSLEFDFFVLWLRIMSTG